ncbi:unnamed protein product [Blepharisma stoltei]|uniref:Major facilitator superfamily (MFS) profile domain-containing protein n=1 Tax=Blepharisma stoltei TaxID=1481888 RepID=A0AAU9KG73_9CILI|nr:unnamed protein product [Blepharisma stoltei]
MRFEDFRLLSIFFSTMLINQIYTVIAPFYPLVAEKKGIAQWVVGLIFTVMPLSGCLVASQIGKNLSYLGRRNTYTGGMLLGGISLAILAFIPEATNATFILMSIISRILGGIGMVSVYITGLAIISSDYGDKRERNISILEVFAGLGLMVGPSFGTLCYALVGFTGIFLFSSTLFFMFTPCLWYTLSESTEFQEVKVNTACWKLLKNKNILLDVLVGLYSSTTYNYFDPSLGPYMISLGFTEHDVGYVFIIATLAYTVGSFGLVFLLSRANKFYLMIWSIVMIMLGEIVLGLIGGFMDTVPFWIPVLGICLASLGASVGFVTPLPSMLSEADMLPHKDIDMNPDALSALFTMEVTMGEIIGPMMAGFLVQFIGFELSSTSIAIIGAILIVIYGTMRRTKHLLISSEEDLEHPLLI